MPENCEQFVGSFTDQLDEFQIECGSCRVEHLELVLLKLELGKLGET